MRTFVTLCAFLMTSLLAGCADPAADDADLAGTEAPMALEVLGTEERVDRCNNAFRDQDILAVQVRLTNLAAVAVGPPEYDVAGLDDKGEDYPMCWPDEVVIAPGGSTEVELRFYVTSEECDLLKELVVRQLFTGEWVESKVPTGIKDPCP